jgi:hypothetical protein
MYGKQCSVALSNRKRLKKENDNDLKVDVGTYCIKIVNLIYLSG